jgi:molybdopterin-synthase adenylyltransferase
MLSDRERKRYSRQMILEEMGEAGQEKLKAARVLMVGAGGLGSPVTFYLAAAGVGTIGILDKDVVELSNLQRQILHAMDRLGTPKATSARMTLEALNPDIQILDHVRELVPENIREFIRDYDVIINGVDNFPTRFLINDACYLEKKPLIEAGVLRFDGLVMTILPDQGPCYRCVFAQQPKEGTVPATSDVGLLATIPGIAGTIQATEAIKVILGIGKPLCGRLLAFNALEGHYDVIEWPRDPDCPLCGENPSITEPGQQLPE